MARSNFCTNSDGTLDPKVGSSITSTIDEAIELAISRRCELTFELNDVMVTVGPRSNADLIIRDLYRVMNGYIKKAVGPMPKTKLTRKEEQSDARIEAQNQARRDAEFACYQARTRNKRRNVEARMKGAPAMEFSDKPGWDAAVAVNSRDSYGAGILFYAERWARMMQLEMRQGRKLEDIWENTSFEADLEGMSGASLDMATHLLTRCWVHGAELLRLRNSK